MTEETKFNLLYDPWIMIENPDGQIEQHGILSALSSAHRLANILETPAATAGIYRLLTAVAQFAFAPKDDGDLLALWDAGQLDGDQIEATMKPFSARFDLFGPEPFYQSADFPQDPEKLPKKGKKTTAKSAAYLWPEMPAGSNALHWAALRTDHSTFCLPCVAAGLTTLPLFISIGGVGYRPSINMAELPVYLLPQGQTLFHSLAGGLLAGLDTGGAWWQRDPVVGQEELTCLQGDLHGYTFMPRRVRVYPRPMYRPCHRCGQSGDVGVELIAWGPGEYTTQLQKSENAWLDPLVGYRVATQKKADDDMEDGGKETPPQKPRYFPVGPSEYAPWRSHSYLLLLHDNNRRPAVVDQAVELGLPLNWRAIAVRNRQAAMLEWYDSGVIHAQLNLDGALASQLAQKTAWSLTKASASALAARKPTNIQQFFSLLEPDFNLLVQTGNYQRWGQAVVRAAQLTFDRVTAGVAAGRREEARATLLRQTLGTLKKYNEALASGKEEHN